ncbi:hypothetical protein pVco14_019 [Vibrio phage pVco-14]|nr:hypothetical protein pVco14_019 [Vibrio phage pVco-14]
MKKLLVIVAAMFASFAALADQAQINFTSNVASYCTVGQIAPGVMHLNGTNVTTDTSAVVGVNSNEGGIYKIEVANPSGFTSVPSGYTGTATLTSSFAVNGANVSTGEVLAGQAFNLDNAGDNTVSVSVAGTTDANVIAGNYATTAIASCIAQ